MRISITILLAFVLILLFRQLYFLFRKRGVFIKNGQLIDTHPYLDNKKCFKCGAKLTDKNTSIWSWYIEHKGDRVSAKFCLMCTEIMDREFSSCKKVGNDLIPSKTKEEILCEMASENITEKFLYERQQIDLEKMNQDDMTK